MKFTWDEDKNIANKKKHGISFETAIHVFEDPFYLHIYDKLHSNSEEDRWQIIGSVNEAVIFVVETELSDDMIRIISARPATSKERNAYYGNENYR